MNLKNRRACVFPCTVNPPGQLSGCRLFGKAEVGGVLLGDAEDNMCPEGERVAPRGLKSLYGNLLLMKCLRAKDGENC